MATLVLTKKKFLTWLNKELENDQVILVSPDLTGEMSLNKKRNEKKVSFAFAADSFKEQDGIGHFAFGKTPVMAFTICKKTDLSDDTLKLLSKKTKI